MGGQFHSDGGEQNIAQGDYAIGKQENNHGPVIKTTGNQAPAVNAQGDVTITYGVPFEKYEQVRDECERLKVEYGIKDVAFASFFRILNQENIPCAEWGAKLPEIAFRYKELLLRFEAVTSDDPQVQALKEQAKQAIKNGNYDRADTLLNQAKERDRAAVATLKASLAEQQAALEKRQLSEAQSCVDQARLQRLQYRYEKSAQYFQEAVAALPEEYKEERAAYLGEAGGDLYCSARYTEALRLYKQVLSVSRETENRQGEARLLNNISQIYQDQGECVNALDYLKQSLTIFQEVGDKEGEGVTLNNIGLIHLAIEDYPKALKYFEQSLSLAKKINDQGGKGITLNNIGRIYKQYGDHATALKYYNQALDISFEIKDKATASTTLNNISLVYLEQGDLDAALEHLEQSLAIIQQIGDRRNEGRCLSNLAAIYEAKEDYMTALEKYHQSCLIIHDIGTQAEEAIIIWNIEWISGWIYMQQGELAKAEQYISRAVELGTLLEHPMLKNARKALKDVRAKLYGRPNLFARAFRSLFRGRQEQES